MAETSSANQTNQSSNTRVIKNTIWLVGAQVVTIPLSVMIQAFIARYLGPSDFGHIYLAQTYAGFAFLILEWGQFNTLPAMVAVNHKESGAVLGTALAWRTAGAILASGVLAGICWATGYGPEFQVALALVVLSSYLWTMLGACQLVVQGFERTDIAAKTQVAQQFLAAMFVVPALLIGFRLRGVLLAQAAAPLLLLIFVLRLLKPVGVTRPHWDSSAAKRMLDQGGAFLVLGLAMALQPIIDAAFISKLAPPEVVGWHASARKLVGMVIFPVTALVSALYPTLARLAKENIEEFKSVTVNALGIASICVVPVSLGCYLYPDIGVRIYGEKSFGPAEQNLQLLAIFVFLLYFSMVLGTALAAMGKQRAWALAQTLCLLVSLVLNPIFIPQFQRATGNGGLGLCISSNVSEGLMVVAGVYLAPRGIFTKELVKRLILTFVSGLAMVGVAKLLRGFSPFLSAPIAIAAYLVALVVSGGLDKQRLQELKALFGRKFARR
jgi:O-antigen/teichoic acid export membrane protein